MRTEPSGIGTTEQARTLTVVTLGTFLALVAFTLPLTTLNTEAAALAAGPEAQTWILSSMSVGLAAGLLISGALADDFGRRRLFLVGAGVLAVTSVWAAVASSALIFVLVRVAQGLGAAALVACALGLVGHVFPDGPLRARATAVWGAAVGAGIAAGPLLAAALDGPTRWRLAYLLVGVLAGALGVAGRILVGESRAAQRHRVDVAGAVLLGTGLSALLAGLVAGRGGWSRPPVVALLMAGALLLVVFALVEWRGREPMLDLTLFRRPDFTAATSAGIATGLGVIAAMSFLPTVIARGLDGGPFTAAIAVFAWSGLSVFSALGARRLPARLDGNMALAVGLLVVAVGQIALTGLSPGDGLGRLLPGLLVAGLGSGVLNAALGRQAVSSVPAGRASVGSGVNNTARYVGSGLGITLVAVLATHARTSGLLAGWNTAVLVSAGFSVLGAAAVLVCRHRSLAAARLNPPGAGSKC